MPGCDGRRNGGEELPKSEIRGGGREELPCVRGQGQRPRVPDCDGTGMAERGYPVSEVRGGDKRSYPASEVRGSGREEQPHVQGAVAARGQEGLEELFHVQGQEGQW